ncbi:uncharacterized protein [Panulirus ornatus]|uniref:uncharacterized protein n=1 Tax=Panulirus ornatus TaxID=150431 RepID=UPI003A89C6B3
MLAIKINPFMKGDRTSTSHKNSYGTLQILQSLAAVSVVLLGGASVIIGLLPISLCLPIFLTDVWLVVFGVTVLGCVLGLMAWKTKMAHGKIINGPKILAILLLILNFLWLIFGNVLMVWSFVICTSAGFSIFFGCGSPFLTFFQVVVLTFDVLYLIFFVALCVFSAKGKSIIFLDDDVPSSDSCCVLPYCLTCFCPFPFGPSWQEWVIVVSLAVFVMLGIASTIVGAIFIRPCGGQNLLPAWNIVNGIVTIATVGVLLFCLGLPRWIRLSWERPSFVAFIPVVGLVVFLLAWLTVGNVLVLQYALEGCTTFEASCSRSLLVFTSVVVFLLDLIVFVLVYVAVVFILLMVVLLIVTGCMKYCGKRLKHDVRQENGSNAGVAVQVTRQEIEVHG